MSVQDIQELFKGLDVGDVIGIKSSGAYGLTASPMHFISHTPPREVIVETTGKSLVIEDVSQFRGAKERAKQ